MRFPSKDDPELEILGTRHAARYLRPGGLWDRWAADRFDATDQKAHIDGLITVVERAPGPV